MRSGAPSSVRREAILILVGKASSAVGTATLAVVLANALGPTEFGRYRLAISATGVAALVAGQGLASSTARYLVDAPDEAHRIAVLRQAAFAKAAFALVSAVALALLAIPIARVLGAPHAWPLFLVAAVAVPGVDIAGWLNAAFQATRQASMSLAMSISKGATELAAAIVLINLGLGAVSGVIAYATATMVACALGIYFVVTKWITRAPAATSDTTTGMMLAFGRQVWFADLAFLGFQTVDQFILQALEGTRSVGVYDVAWQLTAGLALLSTAVGSAVAPRLRDPDRSYASQLFARTVRSLTAFYAAIAASLAVLGNRIIDALFPTSFAESANVIVCLTPYVLLLGIAPLVSVGLNFLGVAYARRRIAVTALLLNGVLDVAAIRAFGTIGPTIGTGVAFSYYVFAHCRLYRRTDIAVPWRGLSASLARGLGAGLVGSAASIIFLHALSVRSPWGVLLTVMVGGLVSVAILASTGESDVDLRKLLRTRIG